MPHSFRVAEPGVEPGCSNFKSRALAALAVVFKPCTQQNILRKEGDAGTSNSLAGRSSSDFICFIYWCSSQDFLCEKEGLKWVEKSLHSALVPLGSHMVQPQDEEPTGTNVRKGGTEHRLHRQTPHLYVLCASGLLLGEGMKGLRPVHLRKVPSWLGLVGSWPGQLCGSCPHKCRALSRL